MLKVRVKLWNEATEHWQSHTYYNVSSVKVLPKEAFKEEVDEYSFNLMTEMVLRIIFRDDPKDCFSVQTATFNMDDTHKFCIEPDEEDDF